VPITTTFLNPDQTSSGPVLGDEIRVRVVQTFSGTPSVVFKILDLNGDVLHNPLYATPDPDLSKPNQYYYTGVDGLGGLNSTQPYIVVAVVKIVDEGVIIDSDAAAIYAHKL
jgi:hypothetical protein